MTGSAEGRAVPTAAPSATTAQSRPDAASSTEAVGPAAPRRPRRQRAASRDGPADLADGQLSIRVEVRRMTPEEEAAMFRLLGRLVADRLSRPDG